MRFLSMIRIDETTGQKPSERLMQEMGTLMEEMIRDGAFQAALDLCTGGVIEHLFQGNRDPGPDRLMAAGAEELLADARRAQALVEGIQP